MQQSYGNQSKAKIVGAVLAVLVIAGIVLLADHLTSTKSSASATAATSQIATTDTSTPSATDDTSTTATTTDTTASASSAYKNGTYTATSDYYVPHGSEEISVKLTIANGIITDSSITNSEGDHDSARYQEDFTASYKSYVVGKSIGGLSLSRVAGASDTTQGFNDALTQIAEQAKA